MPDPSGHIPPPQRRNHVIPTRLKRATPECETLESASLDAHRPATRNDSGECTCSIDNS